MSDFPIRKGGGLKVWIATNLAFFDKSLDSCNDEILPTPNHPSAREGAREKKPTYK